MNRARAPCAPPTPTPWVTPYRFVSPTASDTPVSAYYAGSACTDCENVTAGVLGANSYDIQLRIEYDDRVVGRVFE